LGIYLNISIDTNLYRRIDRRWWRLKGMPKFMQTLDQTVYDKLQKIARERGITIQELIRAVIIPEWLKQKGEL